LGLFYRNSGTYLAQISGQSYQYSHLLPLKEQLINGNKMLNSLSLKAKLIGAFCVVACITSVVGWVGYSGVSSTTESLVVIGEEKLVGVKDMLTMETAQQSIRFQNWRLLNPELPQAAREKYHADMEDLLARIDKARAEYEKIPHQGQQETLWREFAAKWDAWRGHVNRFVNASDKYVSARNAQDEAQALARAERHHL
jgi:hypothetical protein